MNMAKTAAEVCPPMQANPCSSGKALWAKDQFDTRMLVGMEVSL